MPTTYSANNAFDVLHSYNRGMDNLSASLFDGELNLSDTSASDGNSCLLSSEHASVRQVKFVCNVILIPLLTMFGCAGNVLCILVYAERHQLKTCVSRFIVTLCVWDSLFLGTALLVFSVPHLWNQLSLILPYVFGCLHIARTGAIWTAMLISLERFSAIWSPIRHSTFYTHRRALLILSSAACCAVVFSVPRFFDFSVISVHICDLAGQQLVPSATPLRSNETYRTLYLFWLHLILLYLVPFVTILVFNVLIYIALLRATITRQQLSTAATNERSTTVMLLVEALLFIVCNTCSLIFNIIEATNFEYLDNLTAEHFRHFNNVLALIKPATNFAIFYIFGSRFRTLFRKLLAKCGQPQLVSLTYVGEDSLQKRHRASYTSQDISSMFETRRLRSPVYDV